jgi:AcrB/AcrD/AcrF family
MELPELAIRNRTFTWFAVLLLVAAGISAFFSLGQLEDPDFTIKVAVVSRLYPGATPTEVERDVTDRIETKLQELKQVDYLEYDPGGLNEEHAQVAIAALRYLAKNRAVARRELFGDKTQPGGEVAALGERIPGAHRRHHRAGDDRPDPRHAHQPLAIGILVRKCADLA